MDTQTAFELAQLFFAGVSAVAAAVDVWVNTRNETAAAAEFDKTLVTVRNSAVSHEAAHELVSIIPSDVIADLEGRADQCWTGYRQVLGGKYLPTEVDSATVSVQACVCRELNRMFVLCGSIPGRWQQQWDRYECSNRLSEQFNP
jgi:hypothetical protein